MKNSASLTTSSPAQRWRSFGSSAVRLSNVASSSNAFWHFPGSLDSADSARDDTKKRAQKGGANPPPPRPVGSAPRCPGAPPGKNGGGEKKKRGGSGTP